MDQVYISKEEAKETFPDKQDSQKKWRYECYVCGVKVLGSGELIKQCDCMHPSPKKLLNV